MCAIGDAEIILQWIALTLNCLNTELIRDSDSNSLELMMINTSLRTIHALMPRGCSLLPDILSYTHRVGTPYDHFVFRTYKERHTMIARNCNESNDGDNSRITPGNSIIWVPLVWPADSTNVEKGKSMTSERRLSHATKWNLDNYPASEFIM